MEEKELIVIDFEKCPVIVRDTMSLKDLDKIKEIDVKKGVKHGVIQLLNLIPCAGGTLAGGA